MFDDFCHYLFHSIKTIYSSSDERETFIPGNASVEINEF